MMNGSSESPQDSLKRRSWQQQNHNHYHHQHQHQHQLPYNQPGFYARLVSGATHNPLGGSKKNNNNNNNLLLHSFLGMEDDKLVSTVVPQITVVLEGRSICQRISLDKHPNYQSLAKALRQMFVDAGVVVGDHHQHVLFENDHKNDGVLHLSNAIPGHLVAYEDLEDDLLLAGDLNWKDFVRVAKRIRIIPVKANPRKARAGVVP